VTTPEPVSRTCPRPVRHPVLRQSLLDVVFAHWEVSPADVPPHLPPGLHPDTWEGRAYVGLVGVRMVATRPPGLPPLPYVGTFAQVNVRVYAVDPAGRRGVVFCALDAARLGPALAGRAGGLAYHWSDVGTVREGDVLGYTVRRRARRRSRRSGGALVARAGPPRAPSALESFLTARWGLFASRLGRTWHLPLAHPEWALHDATPVHVDAATVRSAGFVVPDRPTSLLWSPGSPALFGPPTPLRTGR
jgi:uncharacterized protein